MKFQKILFSIVVLMLSSCGEILTQIQHKGVLSLDEAKNLRKAEHHISEKKFLLAIEILKDLSFSHQNNKEILYKLSQAYSLAGRKNAEKNVLQKIRELPNVPSSEKLDILEKIALINLEQGKFSTAESQIMQIIAEDASKTKALNALGISFALSGNLKESLEYFSILESLEPENPNILNNQALALAFLDKFTDAEKALKKAIQIAGPEHKNIVRFELNLALIFGMQGKLDEAKKLAQNHLNKEQLLNNMGYYAILSKKKKLAKSYLEKALIETKNHYQKAWNNFESMSK